MSLSGAGGTVIAVLCTMIAAGLQLRDAVKLANRAGGAENADVDARAGGKFFRALGCVNGHWRRLPSHWTWPIRAGQGL